jgi:hypothetical protein
VSWKTIRNSYDVRKRTGARPCCDRSFVTLAQRSVSPGFDGTLSTDFMDDSDNTLEGRLPVLVHSQHPARDVSFHS